MIDTVKQRMCAPLLGEDGGVAVCLLCDEIDNLRAARDEALDVLEECIAMACITGVDGGAEMFDSMCSRTYADAIRLLARHGRVRIVTDEGRRVIAEVIPREERK